MNKLVVLDEYVGKQNVAEMIWLLFAALNKLIKERYECMTRWLSWSKLSYKNRDIAQENKS